MKRNYITGALFHLISRRMSVGAICLLPTLSAITVMAQQQQPRVTFNADNITIADLLKQLNKQVRLRFLFNAQELANLPRISVHAKNEPLDQVLEKIFRGQNIYYNLSNGTLVIRYKPALETPVPATSGRELTGVIRDAEGNPLNHATVQEVGTTRGTYTDDKGRFSFLISDQSILRISYVGMEPKTVQAGNMKQLNLELERTGPAKEVVITGMVTRNKESFTGAVSSFNSQQLKTMGNMNVIQSLKSLDPSFILVENNKLGSNPNALPNIEVRGKSSISTTDLNSQFAVDPNQPLFILNGFETSLSTIVNLDMNRVESITILKDAASTAMYGARAANGVVVVVTRKPKTGELRISYNSDNNVEMPDLRSYNLMNAEEKLLFEKLSGRYNAQISTQVGEQAAVDSVYSQHLALVKRGVNSYWLSEPVRTGITNGHSLMVEGGDDKIQYVAGINYKRINGVMKGSSKDNYGGNIDLTYRRGKTSITNQLTVTNTVGNESPYGTFSTWANMNPYFQKYNDDGSIPKYLDYSNNRYVKRFNVINPFYEAQLGNYDTNKFFSLMDNLKATVEVTKELQAQAGIQLTKTTTDHSKFHVPESADFDESVAEDRGQYTKIIGNTFSYQLYGMLTYYKNFGKNVITANLRGEMQDQTGRGQTWAATGFPDGTNGNPAFAFNYKRLSKPGTEVSRSRQMNVFTSGNYAYDNRFLADFTYRIDGSTAFGSQETTSPFWSVGVGYNLMNESFFKELTFINRLKIRGSYGYTGNQNFSQFASLAIYTYYNDANLFGQGLNINSIGNPYLQWQKTGETNIGLDFSLFNSRINGTINVYEKNSDPLAVGLSVAPSVGVDVFPGNIGHLIGKGLEYNVSFSPIYNPAKHIVWTIASYAAFTKNKYGGIGNRLDGMNKLEQNNKTLQRYMDGYSPEDIWAVRSAGIDPASGREVFIKKDGSQSFEYNTDDIVKVGNSNPFVNGTVSTNLQYKGFTFNATFRFRYGADVYNTALFNKVENISLTQLGNNQDKRALYDRWKKPGDQAKFRGIYLLSSDESNGTPLSSRFVQHDNNFVGESMSIGYLWDQQSWIKKIGMKSFRLSAYLNDIFRLSSVQAERGIEYPFSRAVSFSLGATF
ncbi:SusC/RagA family TonB-linked outer membrane protein [Chitinophaga sp. Cy-1792]|uniref:SusC/RagA family TonB-linked outer membrane protein n=1 Tax=Chitinophaga sp. Cy-1792 TaxID=2608339 RepID=UPI00141F092C|nr:SusC/RagA family TonB-linked outer membrane protein [Chitinophaga sp. Cy-1792]NIG57646.1 SusC/RagA family TonB-linked outer membrane protein [Chitinophaga sp. Cy-1792]